MTRAEILKAFWAKQNLLPSGFRRLKNIQATGTQHIDTGVELNGDSAVELECYYPQDTQENVYQTVYGARSDTSTMFELIASRRYQRRLVFPQYESQQPQVAVVNDENLHTTLQTGDGFYIDGVKVYEGTPKTFSTGSPAYIFANNRIGVVDRLSTGWRVAAAKFNAEISRNYISALCLAGNTYVDGNTGQTVTPTSDKPGMYDLVSGKFFVNQGTGEFLYA